jgi:hypothetical protein
MTACHLPGSGRCAFTCSATAAVAAWPRQMSPHPRGARASRRKGTGQGPWFRTRRACGLWAVAPYGDALFTSHSHRGSRLRPPIARLAPAPAIPKTATPSRCPAPTRPPARSSTTTAHIAPPLRQPHDGRRSAQRLRSSATIEGAHRAVAGDAHDQRARVPASAAAAVGSDRGETAVHGPIRQSRRALCTRVRLGRRRGGDVAACETRPGMPQRARARLRARASSRGTRTARPRGRGT